MEEDVDVGELWERFGDSVSPLHRDLSTHTRTLDSNFEEHMVTDS